MIMTAIQQRTKNTKTARQQAYVKETLTRALNDKYK
jgi:hypothetical protein